MASTASLILCVLVIGLASGDRECGRRQPTVVLTRNTIATDNSLRRENFPWVAAIFRRGATNDSFMFHCGGTLVPSGAKSLLVVTAAHCLTKTKESDKPEEEMGNFRVVLAPTSSNYNWNSEGSGSQKFTIKKIEINPNYDPLSLKSDVAIVELVEPIRKSNFVQPVCLPRKSADLRVLPGRIGEGVGFGWEIRRNISETLHQPIYRVISPTYCKDSRNIKLNSYLEFCTGFQDEVHAIGLPSCHSDNGGGFIFEFPERSGNFYLHGILSNADNGLNHTNTTVRAPCNSFNIYTRVTPFLDWIDGFQERMDKAKLAEALQASAAKQSVAPQFHFPEFLNVAVDLHNHLRKRHGSPPVHIDIRLQHDAQKMATYLVAENRQLKKPTQTPYSTNLYSMPGNVPATEAVRHAIQYWYQGATRYDREHPKPSAFTQLVWKSSHSLGTGVATNGHRTVVVANYWPKGNAPSMPQGEKDKLFSENVKSLIKLNFN